MKRLDLMLLAVFLATPAVAQDRATDESQIYRIVVRALASRVPTTPGLPEGSVVLDPYVLPQALLPPEDGTPAGRRLPASLLRELVDGRQIAGLCFPAPDFRCKDVSHGVAIRVTTIRWSGPDQAYAVGQILGLPSPRQMSLTGAEPIFLGFALTRRDTGWSVADPIPIRDPRKRG